MKLSKVFEFLGLLLTHPEEARSLITFALYHEKKRDLAAQQEHPTSGWDRESMRRCWEFLDLTSRSFAAVIKELDGDLARTICLFYLVLRGLDTIEDDTSLPDEIKQPILRSFHKKLSQPGWNFDGIRQQEKDRQLVVEFDTVITEVMLLEPKYKDAITDICEKMQTGMADYCHRADTGDSTGVATLVEYDLYCHYVAGLVGEGLSRLFSASGKEAPWLGDQLVLSNSLGCLLQKTNIMRDFREDVDENRLFWPREVWARHGFSHPREMYEPENQTRALWALSEMVVDSLRHALDALDYLTLLRNQSVFNFAAIPATMAMATLDLCFMNPAVFHRNIKIRKGQTVQLIMRSTNPREVGYIFKEFARSIHQKSLSNDPSFLAISVLCGKIEQWVERRYPSFVVLGGTGGATVNDQDIRSRIVAFDRKIDMQREAERHVANGAPAAAKVDDTWPWELFAFSALALLAIVALGALIVWFVITYLSD